MVSVAIDGRATTLRRYQKINAQTAITTPCTYNTNFWKSIAQKDFLVRFFDFFFFLVVIERVPTDKIQDRSPVQR
jgi:uncharacterized membrane protein